MKQNQTCFLLHFSVKQGELWDDIYHDKISNALSKEELVTIADIFLKKLNDQNKKIFFSCEETNSFLEKLKTNINDVETLDYKHELFLMRDIFKTFDDIQAIAYFDSLFPLWDVKITSEIFRNHNSYRADYSYGENLPHGMSPLIFGESLIKAFEIEHKDILELDEFLIPLNTYIEKNINNFHVEIHYEEPDLRILRLDFSAKNIRSLVKINRLLPKLSLEEALYQQLDSALKKSPDVLRVAPSYLEIEVIQDCEYKCIFCPRQYLDLEVQVMSEVIFAKIDDYLNSSLRDTSLCLGGLGEPLQHPKINKIVDRFLNHEFIQSLVIETNGYYLEKMFTIIGNQNFEKLQWVFNINSLKNYDSIHGVDASYLEKVKENLKQFIEKVSQKNPSLLENIYIQVLKINETEAEIDDIDIFAKDLGVKFLLQKYNSYISLMPERRVSDMTPLERFSCWHLRRDMSIRANGDVLFCKQGVHGNYISGNLQDSSVQEIWGVQKQNWVDHSQGNYTETPNCRACDEYFTFNL